MEITAELLKHFTEDEVRQLMSYFGRVPKTHCGWQLEDLYLDRPKKECEEFRDFLRKRVEGRKVVEIGASTDFATKAETFLGLGAGEYVAVDVLYEMPKFADIGHVKNREYHEKIRLEPIDGLSYMARQQDASCIVCSFGVISPGVLCDVNDVVKRYTKELCKEIYRATPEGGISLHVTEYSNWLKEAGFKALHGVPCSDAIPLNGTNIPMPMWIFEK